MSAAPKNLYVHFPFCRGKCSYCALHSSPRHDESIRKAYVDRLAEAVRRLAGDGMVSHLSTIYFGGGSPALCGLKPLLDALAPLHDDGCEFTVELHPLDVAPDLLRTLRDGGVNRISMGVQSLDDDILADMGRGYGFYDAERAFYEVKRFFDNAGIDLIVGYPTATDAPSASAVPPFSSAIAPSASSVAKPPRQPILTPRWARLAKWGLSHCSVYSLILEENSALAHRPLQGLSPKNWGQSPKNCPKNWGQSPKNWGQAPFTVMPDDDTVLDQIRVISRFLKDIGLERYEISNYAIPGRECRHNLATWRGEDYIGLGEGAHGRTGRLRTQNWWENWWGHSPQTDWGQALQIGGQAPQIEGQAPQTDWGQAPQVEEISEDFDNKERKIFALRTKFGLDTTDHPAWRPVLDEFVAQGLLTVSGMVYRLTERGTEVCDTILAAIV